MRDGIRVRRGVDRDADALCALSVRAITTGAAGHYSPEQLAAWAGRRTVEAHRRMLQSTHLLVAVEDDVVVGFSSLALQPVHGLVAGEVDQLFVDPVHGGRGIAARLLTALVEVARAERLRELVTHASWRAVPVFESAGFDRVEVESVQLDDEFLTRVLMRRTIDAGSQRT